jgi:hypothetical protein
MIVRVIRPVFEEGGWRMECDEHPELCGRVVPSEALLAVVGDAAACYLEIQPSETGWDVVGRISIH